MQQDLVTNKKAYHDYEILDKLEAGIVLLGTEVKSLREHHADLRDAYVVIKQGELWLLNASISPYSHGNIYNHEEKRERKLLMHRKEILKLKQKLTLKGLTIVPLSLYFKKNHIKVLIGVGKGKKLYDKRADLKKKEAQKQIKNTY